MGQILTLLSTNAAQDVFIDFENARPTSGEMKVYDEIAALLTESKSVLAEIEAYEGCQELAKRAMTTPTRENEEAAFDGLLESVNSIYHFYDFARRLEEALPKLLRVLAVPPDDTKAPLEDQQALAKQLADIFDFALRFDQIRMMRFYLSNDFSYYRRLLPKFARERQDIKVKDDETSGVGLFTAEHIPMIKCLGRAGEAAMKFSSYVPTTLSVMANSCFKMIKSKKFTKPETNLFCARAMTGAIVLYDYVEPRGAFVKGCPIRVKNCVLLLKKEFPDQESLLRAIQFSTKTFSKAPASLQEIFD